MPSSAANHGIATEGRAKACVMREHARHCGTTRDKYRGDNGTLGQAEE